MFELFLAICMYFIAGSCLAGQMDFQGDDPLGMTFILLWPLFMVWMGIVTFIRLTVRTCKAIGSLFNNIFKKNKERKYR